MKLLAKSTHDKHFLSCLIQNAITTADHITIKKPLLKIKLTRFCWEDHTMNNEELRCISELNIHNVQKIFVSSPQEPVDFLELISMQCVNNNEINLIFANKCSVKIIGQDLTITLNDTSNKWHSSILPDNHFHDLH